MCLASNALWLASTDAFSSNLLIMLLIKPLTFAKESSPFEISTCIAESTRDASCAKSIEFSLLVGSLAKPQRDDRTERLSRYSASPVFSEITTFAFASASNSSDRLLLVWTSKSAAFVWIAKQSCIVSSNVAVSSARTSSVIFNSAVSVTNCFSSSSRMRCSWSAGSYGIQGSRTCPTTLGHVVVSEFARWHECNH